jgi:hypothetical protein
MASIITADPAALSVASAVSGVCRAATGTNASATHSAAAAVSGLCPPGNLISVLSSAFTPGSRPEGLRYGL